MGPPRTISAAAASRSPKKALQLAMINRSISRSFRLGRQVYRALDRAVAEFIGDLVEHVAQLFAARDPRLVERELLGRRRRLEAAERDAGEAHPARLDRVHLGEQRARGFADEPPVG